MNAKVSRSSFGQGVAGMFWNYEERRLRLLWRLALASMCTVVLTIVLVVPFYAVSGTDPASYIEKLGLYFAAMASVWLATRFLDRRRFSNIGIRLRWDWWIDLGFGLILGAVLMTVIFLVELAAGWITISEVLHAEGSDQPFLAAILLPVFLFLVVGIAEELVFRGYLLLNLAEGLNNRFIGPRGALILSWLITLVLFGVFHTASPNATIVSAVQIALIGMWLGLGYVLTGSLSIPIGVHIAWNFFQGYVFGFPVSGGREFATTFVAIEQGGPEVWTGGVFGPEAGLLGLFVSGLGALLVVLWIRLRHRQLRLCTTIAAPRR